MNWRATLTPRALEARKHLRELERVAAYIRQIGGRLERIRAALGSIRSMDYSQTRVQQGSPGDPTAAKVAALLDTEREEMVALDRYQCEQNRLIDEINSLADRNKSQILYLRYVGGLTFAAIAAELNYSTSGARYLHDAALEDFAATVMGLPPTEEVADADNPSQDLANI